MSVTINGTIRKFDQELSIAELLRRLELSQDGIAVALNTSVIHRKDHAHTIVHDGDIVEIIRAVAGG